MFGRSPPIAIILRSDVSEAVERQARAADPELFLRGSGQNFLPSLLHPSQIHQRQSRFIRYLLERKTGANFIDTGNGGKLIQDEALECGNI